MSRLVRHSGMRGSGMRRGDRGRPGVIFGKSRRACPSLLFTSSMPAHQPHPLILRDLRGNYASWSTSCAS